MLVRALIQRLLGAIFVLCVSCQYSIAQQSPVTSGMVRAEFLHAWNAYKQYAWGHDALQPLSKQAHDWYGTSLLMTPVDAYDVMLIMGLSEEAVATKKLILDNLSFDKDIEVQAFEITIRLLGGLLSAYQMDGDHRFLSMAQDLANRLLPIYETPTGMPYRHIHLQTGKIRDSVNNPAEIGTALLEFGTLSKLTGNPIYYAKAKNALVQVFNRRSKIGLVGTQINVVTGEWVNKRSHIGGAIDSYYEYLLKAWLLFDDAECKAMWDESIKAVNRYLADTSASGLWYGRADMDSGTVTITRFGSLEAFFPAVLALGRDLNRAERLQESCYKMWNLHGVEPERIDYATVQVTGKEYYLRPEIIESAYYLYHYTRDEKYLKMGETFFNNLVRYCKMDAGYAALKDVTTKEKADGMESFFFAETLKYLYLLFAPKETLPFERVIFSTEAHPMRKTWK
jgi:mannosidase alpha-like ER degradation enhancer 2